MPGKNCVKGLYICISASTDGTLRRWTLSLEGLVNAACAGVPVITRFTDLLAVV